MKTFKEKKEAILLEMEIKLQALEVEHLKGEEKKEADDQREFRVFLNEAFESNRHQIIVQYDDVLNFKQVNKFRGLTENELIRYQLLSLNKMIKDSGEGLIP